MKKLLIQGNGDEIMNIAILQARMSSSRLPGKVLKELLGKPMLLQQIERIQSSRLIDVLIVATSKEKEDDPIEKMCKESNILCYRGSLDNVLDRFYQISLLYQPENIVRLTGDCPLIDAEIIDQVIEIHMKSQNDYTSNTIDCTFPDGLDVEVFTKKTLDYVYKQADRPSLKEHVTLYINENPSLFKRENMRNDTDLSYMRWTVDESEDYLFVTAIYKELYAKNPHFTYQDVIVLLKERPELIEINGVFTRNEGLKKSLLKEGNNI